MSNQELKIGDTVYIDILNVENYMCSALPNSKCLKDKIINITDKYIQIGKNIYDIKTNNKILNEDDDYSPFIKKFYQSKEDLFTERSRFRKYKIFYDAIKNETEYASFLKKLPDETLEEIIKQIQSTNN
jgi:hypothetical protein